MSWSSSDRPPPRHPYTHALLSAVPEVDDGLQQRPPDRIVLAGDVPSPIDKPTGCAFNPWCSYASEIYRTQRPVLVERPSGRTVACHHPLDLPPAPVAAGPPSAGPRA